MITAADITMRFGKTVLFEHVSVSFTAGNRYGLIGANGVGKSTLMKILTGQLESSHGSVAIETGCTLGYLKQDHFEYEEVPILDTVMMGNQHLWSLHEEREALYSKEDLTGEESDRIGDIEDEYGQAGGYTMEADAAKLLVGLGITEDKHNQPMSALTGGFKLRVLLAQVLFAKPDILMLDEPTNHLDMVSIDWLVHFLQRYEGTVVVISHDRYFLNAACTHVADLDYQELRLFTGNYDDFMTANQIALERVRKENARKEKRINELKGFINRFGANASKARQATSRQKELSNLQVQEIKPSSRVSPYIRFEALERVGEKVVQAEAVGKAYTYSLFDRFTATIGRDEKVGIIGTNGVGKSTLLNILIRKVQPDTGTVVHGETVRVSYFPQHPGDVLQSDTRVVDWLARYAPDDGITETELRSALGRMLFRGDDALKPVCVLSGGEKARLILSRMLLEGGNLLVLDEPTNHLDLESIEALNYALTEVELPILFVSHDREFVSSLATRIIQIGEGTIIDYPGTLEEFEAWQRESRKQARAS